MLKDMELTVKQVQCNLKISQDQQKSNVTEIKLQESSLQVIMCLLKSNQEKDPLN